MVLIVFETVWETCFLLMVFMAWGGGAWGGDDLELRVGQLGHASTAIDEHPHGVRRLAGQPVDLQGAEQANDGVGHTLCRLRERAQLCDRRLGKTIEPAIHPFEHTPVAQSF